MKLGYSCPLGPGKCPINSVGWLLCWGKSLGVLNVGRVGHLEGGSQLQGFLPRGPPSSVVGALGTSGRAPRDCLLWSWGASASLQAASASAWWSPPQPPTFDFPTRSLSRAFCKALPALVFCPPAPGKCLVRSLGWFLRRIKRLGALSDDRTARLHRAGRKF